jgi:hypothetical protein
VLVCLGGGLVLFSFCCLLMVAFVAVACGCVVLRVALVEGVSLR